MFQACMRCVCACLCVRVCEKQSGRRCIRYSHMFVCKTSPCCSLVKCQCPLPSVPPTGSFKEVSPRPRPWHLQLFSFHSSLSHHSGSKSRHLCSTKIVQIRQLHLWYQVLSTSDKKKGSHYPISALVVVKDELCRIKSIPRITHFTLQQT